MSYDGMFVKLTKMAGAKLGRSYTGIIFNGVYWFIVNLPYSIDFRNEKFVPGSFFHSKFDMEDGKIGSAIEYGRSIYECFVGVENSDKYSGYIRNGNLLQVCYMFQRMLMGELELPNGDVDFVSYYKIRLTNDSSYDARMMETLSKLPEWCLTINSFENPSERTKKLEEVYKELSDAIGQKRFSTNGETSYLVPPDSNLLELIGFQHVGVDIDPKMGTVLSYVQLLVSTIIPELQTVYNDLVLRGNQLHSIKLVLIQILKDKYGISNIDYSLLFEMIGLDFRLGLRKSDCLRLVRKK